MTDLSRIGVAIDAALLERFDRHLEARGYPSRSEAFRDLIRDALISESTGHDEDPVVGSLTLVYDHGVRHLNDQLVSLQHEHPHAVIATMHVHLDHDYCLEVLVLRGPAGAVRALAGALTAMKGVTHGKLTLTALGSPSR